MPESTRGRSTTGNVDDPGRTHLSLEVEGIAYVLAPDDVVVELVERPS